MKTSKDMNNREIANLLKAIAAAYEVKQENSFRIIAYQRAAVAVEHATAEIKDYWDEGKLEGVPGIGKSIASHLDELFRTGKVRHFEQVTKDLPPAMFILMGVPGIGPKTSHRLCKELGIKEEKGAIEKLEKAAKMGKIARLDGFGEKSQSDILEGIRAFRRGQTKQNRMTLPYAFGMADNVLIYLKKCPAVIFAAPLGSLRRLVSTVGDIDIAVATREPNKVVDWFVTYPSKKKVVEKGPTGATILLQNGRQVDLRVQQPELYGAMLQYFTGSKEHNIRLREYALKKGLSLSEYGIKLLRRIQNAECRMQNYDRKRKIYTFATEERFYKTLGLAWIPPELREGRGEIEAALRQAQGKPRQAQGNEGLPVLVKVEDIKGDFHSHSNFPIEESHDPGTQPMKAMIEKAALLGYQYLGFSEHNPSQSQHSESKIIELINRKKEAIEQINYSRTQKLLRRVFNGLEVDIKPDGRLAIPQKSLALLDYIIVAVHSEFRMERKKMTERVLRALDNPKVKIFGHPTGRKLEQREGYELEWEKIFDFCQKKNIWIEINAWPDRLDLPELLVREAVKSGVKMVINTDAHATEHLELMRFGVAVARRGWAEKKDIVNTLPYDKIRDEID